MLSLSKFSINPYAKNDIQQSYIMYPARETFRFNFLTQSNFQEFEGEVIRYSDYVSDPSDIPSQTSSLIQYFDKS